MNQVLLLKSHFSIMPKFVRTFEEVPHLLILFPFLKQKLDKISELAIPEIDLFL